MPSSGNREPEFEIKSIDLNGKICSLRTKSSTIETPALLPVIHPVRQSVPCSEIRAMGYEAVMTNAYTAFRRQREKAESEGIHKLIGFDGTVMTDSGGYQVLEFGGVEVTPKEIAEFEEKIGTDIATILDKPTGLHVTRKFASQTVNETLSVADATKQWMSRSDTIWALPVQGGKYLDLVSRSARESAKKGYSFFALGSPVEVMESYDFSLLVKMIIAAKSRLPPQAPFHLFGAGHPLVIPLAVALGCDMFDSASYMLYAKGDRYISTFGTVRLEQLEHLGCPCKTCSSLKVSELKRLPKDERVQALARHNLYSLRTIVEQTKQAIWEGRLWEYAQSVARNHPRAFEAFKVAASMSKNDFEIGTPSFKGRGLFVSDPLDLSRPEIVRFKKKLTSFDFRTRKHLIIVPETKTKPFLNSELFSQISRLVPMNSSIVAYLSPVFGLVPAEISDVFPASQTTDILKNFPCNDTLLAFRKWTTIIALFTDRHAAARAWFKEEIKALPRTKRSGRISVSDSYASFKLKLKKLSVD